MRNNIARAHYQQLLTYAEHAHDEGWYYGPKGQFEKRHEQIMRFLNEAILKIDERANKPSNV
jgi:hypothetical protein